MVLLCCPLLSAVAELLSPHHGDDRSPPPPLPESVCLLEEILVDALATITQSMLAVPQINISKDALQAAHSFANTRDGTGLTATTIATATPIDMDALLFVVKNNQHLHEKAKSMITALKPTMDAAQPAKKG